MTVELALSGLGLAAWLYLLLARGGFWRADIRDEVGVAACSGRMAFGCCSRTRAQ